MFPFTKSSSDDSFFYNPAALKKVIQQQVTIQQIRVIDPVFA